MIWLTFLSAFLASAQVRQSLFQSPTNKDPVRASKDLADSSDEFIPSAAKSYPSKNQKKTAASKEPSNLPAYFQNQTTNFDQSESGIIIPNQKPGLRLSELGPGELIKARIYESAIAFTDSKAPVRAVILGDKLKGTLLIGEATLEKNSKRILLQFNKLRRPKEDTTYSLSAHALDQKGILGLEGEYTSRESTYFTGEFLAAGASGYADALVERNQNLLGATVETPSASNATKKALASALSKTAERFSEKLKTAPEYSVLEGPIDIQVIITDEIKTN